MIALQRERWTLTGTYRLVSNTGLLSRTRLDGNDEPRTELWTLSLGK